jgi:hypothetical protein
MSDSVPSSIPIVWGHVGSLKSRLIGLMDHKEHIQFVFGISARSVGEDGCWKVIARQSGLISVHQ